MQVTPRSVEASVITISLTLTRARGATAGERSCNWDEASQSDIKEVTALIRERSYGPDTQKKILVGSGWDRAVSQGTDNWMLPILATFIVGSDKGHACRITVIFSSRFRDRAGLTARLRLESRSRRS